MLLCPGSSEEHVLFSGPKELYQLSDRFQLCDVTLCCLISTDLALLPSVTVAPNLTPVLTLTLNVILTLTYTVIPNLTLVLILALGTALALTYTATLTLTYAVIVTPNGTSVVLTWVRSTCWNLPCSRYSSMKPRTEDFIALLPTGNRSGTVKMMSLSSGHVMYYRSMADV